MRVETEAKRFNSRPNHIFLRSKQVIVKPMQFSIDESWTFL